MYHSEEMCEQTPRSFSTSGRSLCPIAGIPILETKDIDYICSVTIASPMSENPNKQARI